MIEMGPVIELIIYQMIFFSQISLKFDRYVIYFKGKYFHKSIISCKKFRKNLYTFTLLMK
jgi:hypothetical protein